MAQSSSQSELGGTVRGLASTDCRGDDASELGSIVHVSRADPHDFHSPTQAEMSTTQARRTRFVSDNSDRCARHLLDCAFIGTYVGEGAKRVLTVKLPTSRLMDRVAVSRQPTSRYYSGQFLRAGSRHYVKHRGLTKWLRHLYK